MSYRGSARDKVLLALKKLGRTYATKIAKESDLSYDHVHQRILPLLERQGYVAIDRDEGKGPFYELTEKGLGLSIALENPRLVAALFNTEETASTVTRSSRE